jgi:hypothetical protein
VTLFGRAPLVAAYVCPRGVFVVIGRRTTAGVEVERVIEAPASIESEYAAADHLVTVLRQEGIATTTLSITLRGFGVVHHVMQLPPAKDELLNPIIERELRRLEPDLGDSVIGWTPLAPLESSGESAPQRSLFVAAAPREKMVAFEQRIRDAGHSVAHMTALPVAMQRLVEEFDEGSDSVAVVAPLPDGAFMAFSLKGGLRLVVEPPLPRDAEHVSAALAEELDLGAMFVRQQFRGAQLDRIALVGTTDMLADTKTVLTERLRVPTNQLGVGGLSPAGFAALGAILDQQSAKPLSLGGDSRGRTAVRAADALHAASLAALFVLALVGAWTLTETVRGMQAERAVRAARLRIDQESSGLTAIRETAAQRRLVREAAGAVRVMTEDRAELQDALSGISAAVRAPVYLDTLRLSRVEKGWKAAMSGAVAGPTSAYAIRSLHEAARALPQRLRVDSLRLDSLSYAQDDDASGAPTNVRFQFSFGVLRRVGVSRD